MTNSINDLIAKSKQQSGSNNTNGQHNAPSIEKPKIVFNLKPSNSLANIPSPGIGKTATFNFSEKKSPSASNSTPPISSPPAENKQAVSAAVGSDSEQNAPSDVADTIASPVADLANVDVSDFVFKEQPVGYSKEAIAELQGAIDILKSSIDDKQMVGQAITIIMKTVQKHPFLKDIMLATPETFQLMVRGLRQSYGVVIAKKSKTKAAKTEKAKRVDETVNMLGDIFNDIEGM